MTQILAIHSLPDMTEEQAQDVLNAAWAMPDAKLQTTYANFDTGRAICIWEAANTDDVETALKELEVPFEELTEVAEYPRPAA